MKNNFIPQMEPWFGTEEKEALNSYMDEGGWLTEHQHTADFELKIAEYTGAKHCIVVNNGTISLTLIALAAGLKSGDEVIVPNFTMIATPNSLKLFGAIPVFVDVEFETLCINIENAKKAITPKTKAIYLVTSNGRYPNCGIEAFQQLCDDNGLLLLEDAAQSLGSWYPNGKHQGLVGLAGSLSFSSPKIISTGQGGAIITNDDEMDHQVRRLKDFGRSEGGNDIHGTVGYNFKFTELQAVIGVAQMKKLQWRIERKKEIYKQYLYNLSNIKGVKFFNQNLLITTPWFIDVLVEKRDALATFLMEHGIGSRSMYPPINKQKAYNLSGDYPISNLVGEKGLWLPSSSQLTDELILMICKNIAQFYSE
jgi:perosamine synthetase